ncbi:hypothetical protein U1Q18_006038 [Sarracenia purpurea var. burkii]
MGTGRARVRGPFPFTCLLKSHLCGQNFLMRNLAEYCERGFDQLWGSVRFPLAPLALALCFVLLRLCAVLAVLSYRVGSGLGLCFAPSVRTLLRLPCFRSSLAVQGILSYLSVAAFLARQVLRGLRRCRRTGQWIIRKTKSDEKDSGGERIRQFWLKKKIEKSQRRGRFRPKFRKIFGGVSGVIRDRSGSLDLAISEDFGEEKSAEEILGFGSSDPV